MKKFENFKSALANLNDIYKYEEPYENVILTGLVALYEICFEQAWKAIKEVLQNNGFAQGDTGSPKMIIKTAYQAGMIKEEQVWLDALVSGNNVGHAYNQVIAMDIVRKTEKEYYKMFMDLKEEIEKNWL